MYVCVYFMCVHLCMHTAEQEILAGIKSGDFGQNAIFLTW